MIGSTETQLEKATREFSSAIRTAPYRELEWLFEWLSDESAFHSVGEFVAWAETIDERDVPILRPTQAGPARSEA